MVGLYSDGLGGGFPIVAKEEGGVGGVRMYGYIASKVSLSFGRRRRKRGELTTILRAA